MLFDSFKFVLLFLPFVILACYLVHDFLGTRAAQALLLAASLVFYGWSKPSHLAFILASIAVNWGLARWVKLAPPRGRKPVLLLGLGLNILYLSAFKYINFFLSSLVPQSHARFMLPNWGFPLGISFFTLQQIMYLVDCYEGLVPASSLFDHASFVCFFPYVISGPISKAGSMLPQLQRAGGNKGMRAERISRGLYLFTIGLGKKVLLADSFARVVDFGFGYIASLSAIEAWIFSIGFTLQIYFDFSGYTDMAMGAALMLGIEIPQNFRSPLRSKSIIEFWQRWHITLSQFITTYLYTPLLKSFSKATLATAAVATLISMTIAGLWHGPALTFIAFGLLHGIALVVNQYWRKKRMPKPGRALGWILTFLLVNSAFIFFRAPSFASALHMVFTLIPRHHPLALTRIHFLSGAVDMRVLVPFLLAGVAVAAWGRSSDELAQEFAPSKLTCFATAAMVLLAFFIMNSTIGKPFVYFAF